MKIAAIFSSLVLAIFCLSNCKTTSATSKAPVDRFASERASYIQQLKADIKGKEQMPVESVYKNLKVLGGFPAENLLYAMDNWSQALGVGCGFCHDTGNWASDGKPEKEISRQMVTLGEMINTEVRKIPNLTSDKPTVNCATCHRGEKVPALKMG